MDLQRMNRSSCVARAEELGRKGITRRKSMELGSTEAIKQAVAASLGASIVSRYAITFEVATGRLRSAHINDLNLRRHLYVVSHRERTLPPAAVAFRELLRNARADLSREDGGTTPHRRRSR